MILEGEELNEVQQSSPAQTASEIDQPVVTEQPDVHAEQQPSDGTQEPVAEPTPHPLDPHGDRFKQVWARTKKAEERASQLEAQMREERETRIRLEERLAAKETAKAEEPQYTWTQLQAAVDAGTIDMGKAMEIRDQQLYSRWQKEQDVRETRTRVLTDVSQEMNEYKKLVPNVLVPGSDERKKAEREFGYLTQRLGRPVTKEQELSMELAATRAAFGDLDSLKTKSALQTKPLEREPYMETAGSQTRPNGQKKVFQSTLSAREVQHYERLMRNGRYPGGWADVQKENEEYEQYKKGA